MIITIVSEFDFLIFYLKQSNFFIRWKKIGLVKCLATWFRHTANSNLNNNLTLLYKIIDQSTRAKRRLSSITTNGTIVFIMQVWVACCRTIGLLMHFNDSPAVNRLYVWLNPVLKVPIARPLIITIQPLNIYSKQFNKIIFPKWIDNTV